MPLPSSNQIWPPLEVQEIYRGIGIDDAWLTGDTNALETTYANPGNQGGAGWFGGLKRMFWGTPTPQNQTQPPVKLHDPVPAEIARMSAALLFAEMFTALFEDEDSDIDTDDQEGKPDRHAELNAEVAKLLDDNAHARFLEVGEFGSAHGGGYLKIQWDKQLHPAGPFLACVPADTAVPEFRFGILTAVTFWTKLAPVAGLQYTLLERHEPGRILFGLYESNEQTKLGNPADLRAHPDTAPLAQTPGIVQSGNVGVLATGSTLLTAQYIPNVKPNRKWRRDPIGRNLGRSDFDGAYDLFDAIDETFTSYMRDIRLGKARLTVPKDALTAGKPGQGASFNADKEIYVELGESVGSYNPDAAAGGAQAPKMELFQPAIRDVAHRDTLIALKEAAYQACGYSAQSFGAAGDVAITATEATSREKLSILSRAAKILSARPPLVLLIAALVDVNAAVFGGPARPADQLPTVEFPDAASENPKVVADTLNALNTAESTSIKTRVEMLHPDWDGDQVNAEVEQIREDYSLLPMPSEKNLWAGVAADGTNTGGVIPPSSKDPFPAAPPPADDPKGGKLPAAQPEGPVNGAAGSKPTGK